MNEVTDQYRDVIDLKLVSGRWFSREDDGVSWDPVILNLQLAHDMFGSANPVGQAFRRDPEPGDKDMSPEDRERVGREMRVIGIIEDFRQHGELSRPEPFMFRRMRLDDPTKGAPRELLLKVRPGTTADFEETLVKKMQAAAHDWSFEVQETAALRRQNLRNYLIPLASIAVVAGFLLVMVALGLTGVLWQNVTQRTREIGLRRAKGATRVQVHTTDSRRAGRADDRGPAGGQRAHRAGAAPAVARAGARHSACRHHPHQHGAVGRLHLCVDDPVRLVSKPAGDGRGPSRCAAIRMIGSSRFTETMNGRRR